MLALEERSAATAERSHYTPSSRTTPTISPPPGLTSRAEKPWVPEDAAECQFKCCHNCRPTCEPRSYLSLDRILKNDIPSTAAVGFGFHLQGARPVLDASIVKSIGYRPVPLVRIRVPVDLELVTNITQRQPSQHRSTPPASSSSSLWSVLDVIDEQIMDMARLGDNESRCKNGNPDANSTSSMSSVATDDIVLNGAMPRPPRAPPAIPLVWKHIGRDKDDTIDSEDQPPVCEGRRSDSLLINLVAGKSPFTVIEPVQNAVPTQTAKHKRYNQSNSVYEPADAHNVGLFMSPTKITYAFACACATPLPPSTPQEDAFFHEQPTLMEVQEMEEGRFNGEPLEVVDGVAVLEESVEMHMPDVMPQM